MKEELPKTWQFFLEHREKLESREGGRMKGEKDWYGYIYPKNLERFENPKIIVTQFASEGAYMLDDDGSWYYTAGYGILLSENYRGKTEIMSCLLNSKTLDFYLKHIATVKAGGYYEYRSQYVEKLPCIVSVNKKISENLLNIQSTIITALDTENRIKRFPEAYLGDFDGDLGYIDYEWQTRRYPVNADIQEKGTEGRFAVTAGRSDEITDPLMDQGDREERKLRAQYVHAAVDGRSMKKGEEQTIPIPRSNEGVEQLIEALETDRQTVEETSIEELEAEIDETVYDLFDLTEDERDVIEDYLEVF
jgi:hypothetical protein